MLKVILVHVVCMNNVTEGAQKVCCECFNVHRTFRNSRISCHKLRDDLLTSEDRIRASLFQTSEIFVLLNERFCLLSQAGRDFGSTAVWEIIISRMCFHQNHQVSGAVGGGGALDVIATSRRNGDCDLLD